MSSIAEVEGLIGVTRRCLAIPPRNAYEAENAYAANVKRLKEARQKLSDFSGDYVEKLLHEIDRLEHEANQAMLTRIKPVDTLMNLDFITEENAEDEVAEVVQVLEKKREGKKKHSEHRAKGKKSQAKENVRGKVEAKVEAKVETPFAPVQDETQQGGAVDTKVLEVVARIDCESSAEIPLEAIGSGRCLPVPNTHFARLDFDTPVEYDGVLCRCSVKLHQVVVAALSYGTPLGNIMNVLHGDNSLSTGVWDEPHYSTAVLESREKVVEGTIGKNENGRDLMGVRFDNDVVLLDADDDGEEVEDEEGEDKKVEESLTDELSKQLVAEYDALIKEEIRLEEESSTKLLPSDVPLKLCSSLRSMTFLPWVVLMCHGGYFSGGVFVDRKPVVHKSFQRYVVRKKQGGKQSSNDKESGSYGSVGSQIRRAQEIQWKIDVRDILLRWRCFIDAAAVVLYAAPGPQNRAVLSDFSGLPAITTGYGGRVASPVNMKDPRVHKAPLTTHRPTFQEVQRIYTTVSACSLEYVQYLQ